MNLRAEFSREELARALGLGEVLMAAAVLVLAPVVRGETAYGAVHSLLPRTLAGEAYFLIVLAFLGVMILARILAAGRVVLPEPATVALLGAYALYVAVRSTFSDHPYAAQRETLAWLSNFLLFALVLLAAARSGARPVLVAAAAASLLVQSFQVLYQYYYTLPLTRKMLQAGLAGAELDMQNPAAVSRVLSPEPFTTFLHANALGGWMISAALAAAGLCAALLALRVVRTWRYRVAVVFSWIPLVVLFAWAFLLTGSKGAYVAGAAAVAGVLLLAPPADDRWGRRLRIAGAAAVGLMVVGALAYWLFPRLPGRAGLSASLGVRLGYWKPAATMAWEHPFFGVGPGKFGAIYTQLKGPLAEESKSAHSAVMETGAELGLVGLALLAAFWGRCLWRLLAGVRAYPQEGDEPGLGLRRKLLAMALIAGVFFTCVAASWKLAPQWWALGLLALLWVAGFALAAWPLAGAGSPEFGPPGRLLQWALSAAVAAFLIHSSADMGMSLRSLVGPALILAALGLCRPGRRELVLGGRRSLLGAAAVAVVSLGAALLAARDWRRGEAFAAVQAAARQPRPPLLASERQMLTAGRRSSFERIGRELAEWRPGRGDHRKLLERHKAADAALRLMIEEHRPVLNAREKNLVVAGRMEAALEADPVNWPLWVGYGLTSHLLASGASNSAERDALLKLAEDSFRKAAKLAPARTRPHRDLARFYVFWASRGRTQWYRRAVEVYARLAELYPRNPVYVLERADAELMAGRASVAARLYRLALETSRRTGDEPIHLSILMENYNRLKWQRWLLGKLAASLDAALKDAPKSASLLFRRGLVEVARRRFAQARSYMQSAAAADPDDPQLLLFVGYSQRMAGDAGKALETFVAAAKLERRSGRSAGPGAVRRATQRTKQALKIAEDRRRMREGEPPE